MIEAIKEAAQKFKEEEFSKVRVISHYDADGISSAALIIKMLEDLGIEYHLSILRQIYLRKLNLIGRGYDAYLFLDLGSSLVNEIENKFQNVFILDHHRPKGESKKAYLLNPFLYGIDGDKEISASGICYLFAKEIDPKVKELGYLAIVGAFGDCQEIIGLNRRIVEELVREGIIEIRKGLRVFGRTYKPIHKAIAYSFDPYLNGITENEEKVIKILKKSGIEYKIGDVYKTISDLTIEEERELISNIIIEMIKEDRIVKPHEIIGDIYLVKGKKGILSDCREIATLLNAFGRMRRGEEAILLLLGKEKEIKAYEVMEEYKKEIFEAFKKIKEGEVKVKKIGKFTVIFGEDKIRDEIIGTITSMVSRSFEGEIFVGFSFTEENTVKVSVRSDKYDCREIVERICKELNCEGGGHERAAGLEFEKEKLEDFLSILQKVL